MDPTVSVCPSPHASPMNLRILQIAASLNRTRASADVQLPQKWITLFQQFLFVVPNFGQVLSAHSSQKFVSLSVTSNHLLAMCR